MDIQGTPAEIQTLAECALRRLCYRPAIFSHSYWLIALSSPQGNIQCAKKCFCFNFVLLLVFKIAGLKLHNFKLRPRRRNVLGAVSVVIRAPCEGAELWRGAVSVVIRAPCEGAELWGHTVTERVFITGGRYVKNAWFSAATSRRAVIKTVV